MKMAKKTLTSFLLIGALGASSLATASVQERNRVERLFGTPDAQEIIQNHNQRIANIDSEIQQVTDLINRYARFQNRMESTNMSPALKRDMKKVMEMEIERYWRIHRMLTDIRQELETRPSLSVRD
jgi:Skp family chaperone for outer membrane proteins